MVPGIGPQLGRQLVAAAGCAENVWQMQLNDWKKVEGIGPKLVQALSGEDQAQAEQVVSQCNQLNLHLICPENEAYPERLRPLDDAPLVLFVRGDAGSLNHAPILAVVGARRASREGKLLARRWSRYLSERGICIVSGMAYGIDAAAHGGALEAESPTIAVLGCGLAAETNQQIQKQMEAIADQGCVVSEFLPGTGPRPEHFPRRNRIIAGLAQATLVVEADTRSGSLITAGQAAAYGREVLAVPGAVLNGRHAGCHHLIRDGAMLVESAQDILTTMRWQQAGAGIRHAEAYKPANEAERKIMALLQGEILHIDTLAERCGLTVSELSPILIALELVGVIESLPGSRYAFAVEEHKRS